MTDDADPWLVVDGARVAPSEQAGDDIVFHLPLPANPESVRLVSRVMIPEELGLARDPRRLGLGVRRVSVHRGNEIATIRAHDRRLTDGFHQYEAACDVRWTDGDAALPAEAFAPFEGAVTVVVHLGAATRYPLAATRAA